MALYVTSPYDKISSWCRLKCEFAAVACSLALDLHNKVKRANLEDYS